MKKIKVLHISLAHGGGVVSALDTYIRNSVDVEHVLVALKKDSFSINVSAPANLKHVYYIQPSLSGLLTIYGIFRDYRPDYIHMHSSFAGFFGRLMFPFFKGLVYTPHCFSFERTDVSYFKNKIFFLAEKLLSFIPVTYAGCSPREVKLAENLTFEYFRKRNRYIFLPNFSDVIETWNADNKSFKTVVMIGRLCAQKDPAFFAKTYAIVKEIDNSINFLWLGSGDVDEENYLKSRGIGCTGWLSRIELINEIKKADLYFHSAAWEGNPMSILEVSKMKMPIVARKISSLDSIGLENSSSTPEGCAELILKHFTTINSVSKTQHVKINNLCSIENQISALEEIYKL